jgi:hypothetical protein
MRGIGALYIRHSLLPWFWSGARLLGFLTFSRSGVVKSTLDRLDKKVFLEVTLRVAPSAFKIVGTFVVRQIASAGTENSGRGTAPKGLLSNWSESYG